MICEGARDSAEARSEGRAGTVARRLVLCHRHFFCSCGRRVPALSPFESSFGGTELRKAPRAVVEQASLPSESEGASVRHTARRIRPRFLAEGTSRWEVPNSDEAESRCPLEKMYKLQLIFIRGRGLFFQEGEEFFFREGLDAEFLGLF